MIQLYTFGTPNGQKISIMLEELQVPYETYKIDITRGDQHTPQYLKVNPNGKIPAIHDTETGTTVFESVAILIYLAEKHKKFLPESGPSRYGVLQWSLFQAAGLGPMFGQFGHFKVFAKEKILYGIERYQKESFRILGVLNRQLELNQFIAGPEYSIADIATWPWVRGFQTFYKENIDEKEFPHVIRWYNQLAQRPAIQKGLQIPQS